MDHFVGDANKSSEPKKQVIVMDEVDGCSAGDQGGIAALCKLIAQSLSPIVCIANDRGSRKIS